MADAAELVKTIKKAALDAVKADKPVEVCFGNVISTSPLKILVEQKLTLGAEQLVLTKTVAERGIAVGTSLLLIRFDTGQRFAAIDTLGGNAAGGVT